MKFLVYYLILLLPFKTLKGEELFIDAKTGSDAFTGTREQPLKTLMEAARRVNRNSGKGSTTIFLSPGVYLLTETALFNNLKYTEKDRLLIRAQILPDDSAWFPNKMPVIVTVAPLQTEAGGEQAIAIQVETNHVTIQGLRFTGSPDYTYMRSNKVSRSYPIWRGGKSLEDLVVTQCLFAGDPDVLPLHLGIIANGQGLVVDHCVFYRCKNTVVFWQPGSGVSSHNAMQYCLVYDCYFSGVWTTSRTNGGDFRFHHNVIASCKTAWIREKGSTNHFKVRDCLFAGNASMSGFGSGAASSTTLDDTGFLEMTNVQREESVTIEKDQSSKRYLQLAAGTNGTQLKAGLFKL